MPNANKLVKNLSLNQLEILRMQIIKIQQDLYRTQVLFINNGEIRNSIYTVHSYSDDLIASIINDNKILNDSSCQNYSNGTSCEYCLRKMNDIYYEYKKKYEYSTWIDKHWAVILFVILIPFLFSAGLIFIILDKVSEFAEIIRNYKAKIFK